MNRQEHWKEKGYTQEQINNHLRFERAKSKESRERRNKNNLQNKEIIEKIKGEILHKTFYSTSKTVFIEKISPTVDGKGFYYKYMKRFKDGSEGYFREFMFFDDYSLENFTEFLFM
jgi:hypothetical protein